MSGAAAKPPPSEDGPKSTIPGMWAIPAEETARIPRRPREGSGAKRAVIVAGAALLLAGGAFVAREQGLLFPEAPGSVQSQDQDQNQGQDQNAGQHQGQNAGQNQGQNGSQNPDPEPSQDPEPSADPALEEGTADPEPVKPLLTELPARRKARDFQERAAKQLLRGNDKSARILLERALQLDPLFAPGWRDLGIAKARLGDTEGAREAYQRYLELAPDAPDAPDVRRILGQ